MWLQFQVVNSVCVVKEYTLHNLNGLWFGHVTGINNGRQNLYSENTSECVLKIALSSYIEQGLSSL